MIIDQKPSQSGFQSGGSGKTLSESHSQTPLDPGPPPRRKSTVNCKCISWTLFTVVVLFALYWAAKATSMGYQKVKEPWSALYQDPEKPYRPQDVVRPLIDSEQTFDIVATVWLRTERPVHVVDTIAREENEEEEKSGDGDIFGSLASILAKANKSLSKEDASGLSEKAIWTGTVFKNLRLDAKYAKTSVTFQVPTEIFKKPELHSYDLRGSFVLIPTSPSPLDFVSNYTTWLPDSIKYPASRSWPEGYERTLAEEAVDAYGTFIPLLSFHNIKSRCQSSEDPTPIDVSDDAGYDDSEEGSDDPLFDFGSGFTGANKKGRYDSQGQPPLASHPYIITRSFLRVVDMTKIMNRRLYEKSQKQIKALACGAGFRSIVGGTEGDWRLCTRSYRQHGNQEVKLKLTKKSEKTGNVVTEYAYAPFLSLLENSYGPLDLVAVPVNREDCANKQASDNNPIPDEENVEITWNIAFSGRTPEKLLFADTLNGSPPEYNMTDTERNLLTTHASIELSQSLTGHHFRDDYHPRRVTVLTMTGHVPVIALSLVAATLELHYWYSRSSTVGIAVLGTILSAGGSLLDFFFETISGASEDGFSFSTFLWILFRDSIFHIFSFVMLKAVLRADLHWSKYWIPIVHFAPASHAERASQRLESYPSTRSKLLTFIALGALYSFCEYQSIYLINPRGISAPRNTVTRALVTVQLAIILPAITLGQVLQIVMNSRTRKFAGTYKLSAWFNVVALLLIISSHAPWIVGESKDSVAVTVYMLFEVLLAGAMAFQALRYPSVSSIDEEEDTK